MLSATIPNVKVEHDIFPLVGGLDQHTPHLAFKPGAAREAVNFEVSTNGGYARVAGYERFDGRPSPSAASYGVVSWVAGAVNYALRSEELDNVATWSERTQLTAVTANAIAAPDGTLTAEKLVPNTASTNHYLGQLFSGIPDNTTLSCSVYVKKGEYDRARLSFICKNGSGPVLEYRFSTNTMTVASRGTGQVQATFWLDVLSNGWFRLRIWNFSALTGGTTPRLRCYLVDDAGATTFAGDGAKGTYFWGAQLEYAATVGPYTPTTGAISGGTLAVSDTVTGRLSGAVAQIIRLEGELLVYSKASGSFVDGEHLMKGGVAVAQLVSAGVAITDPVTMATYRLAAADLYRADIAPVPGVGPVRGGFHYGGFEYAIRDNVAVTAAVLWRSSGTGWTAVALPYEVSFSGGSGLKPAEGGTITQGAVSAVVRRVVTESGSWDAGTAAGRFIIAAPTGGNFASGALTAGATANIVGTQSQVVLLPGGRWEFDTDNAGNGVRVYGADGVNRLIEFDGTYVVPIRTGMPIDAPTHVKVHKKHVFASFGSSVQHSGVGTPYAWTVLLGAGEMVVNDNVTGFLALPSDASTAALAVLTFNQMHVLYGTSSANWNLVPLNKGAGARPYSAQALGQAYVLDDNGLVAIESVQTYGNFDAPRLTDRIRRFLNQRSALLAASVVNYDKQQYRAFFSDGYGVFATIVGRDYKGAMPVFFPHPVFCTWTGRGADGRPCNYFGSTNGYVYRMDIGTSFDGQPIDYSFSLAFAFQKAPRYLKSYKALSWEIQGDGYFEFNAGYSFGYGAEDIDQPFVTLPQEVKTTSVFWDAFTWDNFYWDGRVMVPTECELDGTAENISLIVEGSSALWPQATFNSVALDYIVRRRLHRV